MSHKKTDTKDLPPFPYAGTPTVHLDSHGLPPFQNIFTPDEIAVILKVDPVTVRNWLRSGRLDGHKLSPRAWRVNREALLNFMDQQCAEEEQDTIAALQQSTLETDEAFDMENYDPLAFYNFEAIDAGKSGDSWTVRVPLLWKTVYLPAILDANPQLKGNKSNFMRNAVWHSIVQLIKNNKEIQMDPVTRAEIEMACFRERVTRIKNIIDEVKSVTESMIVDKDWDGLEEVISARFQDLPNFPEPYGSAMARALHHPINEIRRNHNALFLPEVR